MRKLSHKIDKIKKVELLAQKMAQCIALFPETLFRKLCKFFSRGIVSQVPEANTICRAGCHPSRLLQTIGPPCAMRCNVPLPFKQTLGPCLLQPKIRSLFLRRRLSAASTIFSLINTFIFRENTPISQIVCRLWDITISYSREKYLPGLCR